MLPLRICRTRTSSIPHLLSQRTRTLHSTNSSTAHFLSATRVPTTTSSVTPHRQARFQSLLEKSSAIPTVLRRNTSTAAAVGTTPDLPAYIYRPLGQAGKTTPSSTMTVPLDFPPPPPLPKATGKVDLKLPPTEDRPHRYFVLPNGMEVIAVSDPKADKAAASMDVGIGHLSDPDNLAGCAHFCEHLMFMGTKTYPSENEYQQYLSAHNGHSNAYTAMTSTNYYFDVAPDALEGAVDRFAGFFSEPLFAEDCTEREINAVNSEHKKNLQNDRWRSFQLSKHLAKPGHVYGKFGTGDLDSLWTKPRAENRDPRQQLIEWWKKEYCARRMKLAIAGREDLDTLERMVRERFDAVPVRTEGAPETGPDGVRVTFEDSPYDAEQRGVVTFVKPVRDVRMMEISVPIPDLEHLPNLKPFNFISHFIGHEGKGSLLSYLKRQGWVNELSAGGSAEANGFGFFKVNMQLTPDGLEHWKDVSLAVFKYFTLLRDSPVPETAFKEVSQLADISYRYADRGKTRDYVCSLSTWMQDPVERNEIVSSKYLYGEFDGATLKKCFELLDPRQAAIGIAAQVLPKDVEGTFDQKEPIYGTEFLQQRLPEEFLATATSGEPLAELALPGPNEFVPQKLDVEKFEVDQPSTRPELLSDTEISRLWYKRDDRFWLPKTNLNIDLHSPLIDVTPRNAVLTRLLCDIFTDATTEDSYDATLAELSFHLWFAGDAINISVAGFTDKLAHLAETMLTKLKNLKVDPERFDKLAYAAKMQWQNFPFHEPYMVAHYWSSYVTMQQVWTPEEKLREIEHITPADVEAFGRELFQRLSIETLVHGNTSPEGAKEIQAMLERVLDPRALSPAERNARRTLLLPPNSQSIWEMPVGNPKEPNNAVVYIVHIGDVTDPQARAHIALLGQIASEPAFNMLRTKEQLGYIVQASATSTGLRVLVQSERDPAYVEGRIEVFLDTLEKTITEMTDEEFDRQRQSLIAKKEESPKNLHEESRRFWQRISDKYYEFSKRETDIAELRKATKDEVLAVFKRTILPSSQERRKLSIHLRSQVPSEKEAEKAETNGTSNANIYIKDINQFKAGLIPNKAAVPVEPLVVSKL